MHQECKLQAKNEKIRKKVEVLTGLVNKLLCLQQSKTKTITDASQEAPIKGARDTRSQYIYMIYKVSKLKKCAAEKSLLRLGTK